MSRRTTALAIAGAVAAGTLSIATVATVAAGAPASVAASAAPVVAFASRPTAAALGAPGRLFAAAAGDSSGKRTVVYGGQRPSTAVTFADTWVNGADGTWKPVCGTTEPGATAPCGPGPREAGGMASAAGGVVLYGGFPGQLGGSTPDGATWRWNGTTWSRVCDTASCGPGDRALMAMAGNGTTAVMFGGLSTSGPLADTWVFDGRTWTEACGQPSAPCGPAALAGAAMAWDGTHFVLFGGAVLTGNSAPVDDTWTFDGHHWTKVCGTSMTKPCGPSARDLAAFAFAMNPTAAHRGAILAEGGNIFGNGPTQHLERDAWFFDGARWTRLDPPWNGPRLTFPANGNPAAGPDVLLGVMASKPALCEVVYFAAAVTQSATPPTFVDRTFVAGRDPWAADKPDCIQPEKSQDPPVPVVVATSTTSTSTTVVAPGSTPVAGDPTLPRTGSAALGTNALVGVVLVALGALALGGFGSRRRRSS